MYPVQNTQITNAHVSLISKPPATAPRLVCPDLPDDESERPVDETEEDREAVDDLVMIGGCSELFTLPV